MTIRFVFTTPGKALSLSCKRCSLVQHQRERKLSVDVTWASEYGSAILQKRENLRVRRRQLSRTKRGFASWDAFSLSVCKCVWVFLFLSFCRGRDASREFSRFVSEILCWQFWVFNFSLTYPYLFLCTFLNMDALLLLACFCLLPYWKIAVLSDFLDLFCFCYILCW